MRVPAATTSSAGVLMKESSCRSARSRPIYAASASPPRDTCWPNGDKAASPVRFARNRLCGRMRANLPLDADLLWADVMALAEITDPARPFTRRSFTAVFLERRAFLARRLAEAGLATRIDTAGNLIGRLEGRDPALGGIAIGSHRDTGPSGGRFDGIAGGATPLGNGRGR